jgi:hypothetical protein
MDTAVQASIFATMLGSTSTRAKRVPPETVGLAAVVTSLTVGPALGRESQEDSDTTREAEVSVPTILRKALMRIVRSELISVTGVAAFLFEA